MQALGFGDLLVGIGVLFVVEGLLLAGAPTWIRSAMESLIKTPDNILRVTGLVSAICGLILIWIVRQ